jgi:hypothetical protein
MLIRREPLVQLGRKAAADRTDDFEERRRRSIGLLGNDVPEGDASHHRRLGIGEDARAADYWESLIKMVKGGGTKD